MNRELQKIFLVFIVGLIQIINFSYADDKTYPFSGLEIKLSMLQDDYVATDKLQLDFTLTNTTNEAITFLKWETPFENDFTGDMLNVQYEGQPVQYIGKIVKRIPPEESDFITIEAGETISSSVDITDGYAIEHRGDYTIAFNQHLQIVNGGTTTNLSDVTFKLAEDNNSPAISFKLNEERNRTLRAKQANFSSCSVSQQSILNDAQAAAITIAKESRDILINTVASEQVTAERYTTWFGSHTSARYSTVTDHFTKIHDALANQQVGFFCDCDQNFFAYVFTGDAYNIHLCNAFWNANLTGTDSQAGTLVHEMSHFVVVASTDDNAYGTSAAKTLASSNPDGAIDNADNHEYFAENMPELSMGTLGVTIDVFEEDDLQSMAKDITSDNDQVHSLVPANDQDWLKFVLTEKSNVTIMTSGVEGDTRLSLFNASSTLLAENDDNGTSTFSKIAQPDLAAGEYFIKVDESGNDAEVAKYTLAFSATPTYEPNNTQNDAKLISTGSTQAFLSISPSTDEDWLQFTLTEESELVVEVTAALATDDILLSLLDASGTVLAKQSSLKTVTSKFLKTTQSTLAAGTYFLKVEENGKDQEIAAYSLSVTSKPVEKVEASSGGGGSFPITLISLLILLGLFKMRRK